MNKPTARDTLKKYFHHFDSDKEEECVIKAMEEHAQNEVESYKASLRKEIEKSIVNDKHVLDNPTDYHNGDVIQARLVCSTVNYILSLLDTIKDDQDEKLTGTIKADGNFTVINTPD